MSNITHWPQADFLKYLAPKAKTIHKNSDNFICLACCGVLMKVVLVTISLMFLVGCSATVPQETPTIQQVAIIQKSEKWLPTHHITSQDFVFKNGKVCSVNSLGYAFCSSTTSEFSLNSDINPHNDTKSPLTLDDEIVTNRLKYLVKLKNDTALEYSIGHHALTVSAKHSF